MKAREMLFMIGGLVVGLALGAALIGTSEDLRTGLFGTAADPGGGTDPNIEFRPGQFYLVDFDEAEDWLQEIEPEVAEELEQDINSVQGLESASDLGQHFRDNQDSVDTVLFTMHNTLLREEGVSDENLAGFATCIGIDTDPYSTQPGLYLYLEIPSSVEGNIPANWQKLDGPRENNMLWSTTCFKPPADDDADKDKEDEDSD